MDDGLVDRGKDHEEEKCGGYYQGPKSELLVARF